MMHAATDLNTTCASQLLANAVNPVVNWYLFVRHASGMARYRDPVFHPFVRPSICPSVRPFVNICDHPSIDPTVQVCNSETL